MMKPGNRNSHVNISPSRQDGMTEFDRKVEEAYTRFNRSVANIAETLEKETAQLVAYLNDEVVPAVRTHSSKALRTAAGKLSEFADFLETQRKGS